MKVFCINYLCLVDRIDGGLKEYHKDRMYIVHSVGDTHIVDGYPLTNKQINNNFITIYESRNRIIKNILE